MKALGRAIARMRGIDAELGRHVATSILHRLWEWATDYAPNGSLAGVELEDLAEELRWSAPIEPLINAMQDERSRWLDVLPSGELYIHDWHDHCERYVHRKLIRARARFANGQQPCLTGINDRERPAIQAWYDENPPQDRPPAGVRTAGAQRASSERTADAPASPRLASPRHASGGEQINRGAPPERDGAPDRSAGSLSLIPGPEPPDPPPEQRPSRKRDRRDDVRAIWPACQAAAWQYERGWDELNPNRLKDMNARLMERPAAPAEILVHAIHGAMRSWGTGSETFDPKKICRPETIYRASKFPKYLEAYAERNARTRPIAKTVERPVERATPEQRAQGLQKFDEIVGELTSRMKVKA